MRDKKLAEKFSKMPCEICGTTESVAGHHIISFGSSPELDIEENMMALCFDHHALVHRIGTSKFIKLFCLENKMIERGFFYEGKWRRNHVDGSI